MSLVEKLFGSFSDRELKKINPIAKQVLALEEKYAAMPDADLQAQTAVFKQQLADGKTTDDILPDAFAVCREAAWRVPFRRMRSFFGAKSFLPRRVPEIMRMGLCLRYRYGCGNGETRPYRPRATGCRAVRAAFSAEPRGLLRVLANQAETGRRTGVSNGRLPGRRRP